MDNHWGDRDWILPDEIHSPAVSKFHDPLPLKTDSFAESKDFITVWKATGFGNWGSRIVWGTSVLSKVCTWKLRPLSSVTR